MNKLLTDVKQALRNERYTMRSFGLHHGFSPDLVDKTLRRVTSRNKPPYGKTGKKILAKIKEVTGYDLLNKLEGGND